jgi:L-2-hydroxyglutarate oxidase LhgO
VADADFDLTVIGAGVVGLAIGRSAAARGLSVLILEREDGIGRGISSRNSEVIHAGIYYPQASLKARLCIEGRHRLYSYLPARNVEFKKCGKLILATSEDQIAGLKRLNAQAKLNGVENMQWLDKADVNALEPELIASAALLSPETGIIDSHGFMIALQGDLENAGGLISFRTPFMGARYDGVIFRIFAGSPEEKTELTSRAFVNASGLWANEVARGLSGVNQAIPEIFYAKGNYFSYSGSTPFRRLIYPLPEPGGLGVHLTLDLNNRGRFGPDVEWIETPDFMPNAARGDTFVREVSQYWPEIVQREMTIDFCGIRPKLTRPGEPAADFRIDGPDLYDGVNLVQLFGIESPGLTSALAIGEYVVDRLIL